MDSILDLMHQRLALVPDLSLYPHLTQLILRQNWITDAGPILVLGQLEVLDLYDNRLSEVDDMDGLVHLWFLDLSFNNIRRLPKLPNSLRELYLVSNKLATVEIPPLENLEILELGDNRLTSIPLGLECLVSLESLWLGKNRISQIRLPLLQNLRILNLQNNRLNSVVGIPSFPCLEELYLSHNRLAVVDELACLPKLRLLDVSYNHIKSLTTLTAFANLVELWANDNRIESISDLPNLPLRGIYCQNNLFSAPSIHRLIHVYPTLEEIDGKVLNRP